jgi:hypothetical protein
MAANDYQFITHWRVEGSAADAYDVLVDAQGYLRWWPQVYLGVTLVKPSGEHGFGGVFDLYTRGTALHVALAGASKRNALSGSLHNRGHWRFCRTWHLDLCARR